MRYYGFYSKHHKQKRHYHRLISKEQFINLKKLLYWRFLSLSSFNVDPYKCKKCNSVMEYFYGVLPGERFF